MPEPALTVDRLREVFHYDLNTGVFTRLVRTGFRVRIGDEAGSLDAKGYIVIGIDRCVHKAHRLAWFYVHGVWPTGQIDHINADRADNSICNLRDVSQSLNQQNQKKARSNNRSGFFGVSKNKNRWMARINIDGTETYIGNFCTPELAQDAYLSAKQVHHAIGGHLA